MSDTKDKTTADTFTPSQRKRLRALWAAVEAGRLELVRLETLPSGAAYLYVRETARAGTFAELYRANAYIRLGKRGAVSLSVRRPPAGECLYKGRDGRRKYDSICREGHI